MYNVETDKERISNLEERTDSQEGLEKNPLMDSIAVEHIM